jgi:glycerol kinase
VTAIGLVLAIDQGTTSSRAILSDHAGRIVGRAAQELPQIYPAPGQVEHDPEVIWDSQLAVARQVLAEAGVAAARLGWQKAVQRSRDWAEHD